MQINVIRNLAENLVFFKIKLWNKKMIKKITKLIIKPKFPTFVPSINIAKACTLTSTIFKRLNSL